MRPDLKKIRAAMLFLGVLGYAHTGTAQLNKTVPPDIDNLNPEELVFLGKKYESDVPRDYALAITLFRRAATKGDAQGELFLGESYADGIGVTKNIDQAIFGYQKSAEQGNVVARKHLMNMFYSGNLNPVNTPETGEWWGTLVLKNLKEKTEFAQTFNAAGQGDVDATMQLGIDYVTGFGVTKNYALAKAEFFRAAQRQQIDAKCLFDIISGANIEDEEIVHQCTDAANHGSAISQLAVSYMYRNARFGLPRDLEKMVYWERQAAEQGLVDAEYSLGRDYVSGYGIAKDEIQADDWYKKAVKQGNFRAMGELSNQAWEAHDPRFAEFKFEDPLGDTKLQKEYEELSEENAGEISRDLMLNLFTPSTPRRWGMP